MASKLIGLPTDAKWFLPPAHNIRIVALSLDISPLAFKLRFVVLPFWFWGMRRRIDSPRSPNSRTGGTVTVAP